MRHEAPSPDVVCAAAVEGLTLPGCRVEVLERLTRAGHWATVAEQRARHPHVKATWSRMHYRLSGMRILVRALTA